MKRAFLGWLLAYVRQVATTESLKNNYSTTRARGSFASNPMLYNPTNFVTTFSVLRSEAFTGLMDTSKQSFALLRDYQGTYWTEGSDAVARRVSTGARHAKPWVMRRKQLRKERHGTSGKVGGRNAATAFPSADKVRAPTFDIAELCYWYDLNIHFLALHGIDRPSATVDEYTEESCSYGKKVSKVTWRSSVVMASGPTRNGTVAGADCCDGSSSNALPIYTGSAAAIGTATADTATAATVNAAASGLSTSISQKLDTDEADHMRALQPGLVRGRGGNVGPKLMREFRKASAVRVALIRTQWERDRPIVSVPSKTRVQEARGGSMSRVVFFSSGDSDDDENTGWNELSQEYAFHCM